jgi:hypothetical protein
MAVESKGHVSEEILDYLIRPSIVGSWPVPVPRFACDALQRFLDDAAHLLRKIFGSH